MAEIPSNWLVANMKHPSWFLCGLAISWGIIATLHGFVRSYGGLVAARVTLGLVE